VNATLESAEIMLGVIRDLGVKDKVGFKPAGRSSPLVCWRCAFVCRPRILSAEGPTHLPHPAGHQRGGVGAGGERLCVRVYV